MGFRFATQCNPCCVCSNHSAVKFKVSDCCYGWTGTLTNTYMRLFVNWGTFPHNAACPENFGYTFDGTFYIGKPGCILSYLGASGSYFQWRGEVPDGRYCIIETSDRYFESAVGWNCYARTLENIYIYQSDGSLQWSYKWTNDRNQYEASYLCSTCGDIALSADCNFSTGNIFCDRYVDCPGLTRDNYQDAILTVTTSGFTNINCEDSPGCTFTADTSQLNNSWQCFYRQGMPYLDYLANGSVGTYAGIEYMSDVKYANLDYTCDGTNIYPCNLSYRAFVYIRDICYRFGVNTANAYSVDVELWIGTLFGDEGNTCVNSYRCGEYTTWCRSWTKVDLTSSWVVGVPGTVGYGASCPISVSLSG